MFLLWLKLSATYILLPQQPNLNVIERKFKRQILMPDPVILAENRMFYKLVTPAGLQALQTDTGIGWTGKQHIDGAKPLKFCFGQMTKPNFYSLFSLINTPLMLSNCPPKRTPHGKRPSQVILLQEPLNSLPLTISMFLWVIMWLVMDLEVGWREIWEKMSKI